MRLLPSDDDKESANLNRPSADGQPEQTDDLASKDTVAPSGRARHADGGQILEMFGKYVILHELGRGGMAVVYEARDEILSRRVALKLLPLQYSSDPEFVERFHREAQAAAVLEHPAIISIFDLGCEGGTHYIAMELVEGESLHDLQNEERLDDRSILDICAQVADGLSYAHSRGIVHRDIKPSNIMVDRDGRARITDFGLARPAEAAKLTATGDVLGSPAYMSPEQAKGLRMDHRTDIYSLGTVLYELLCDRPPFKAETTLELLKMVADKIPPRPRTINPKIPRKLEAVILKAMEHDLRDRYQDAARLADDLKAYLAGEPVSVRPPRIFERIDRFGKRHRVALTFVATASLAVTVSVRYVTGYISRERHREVPSVAEHMATARSLTGKEKIGVFSYADSLLTDGKHRDALAEYERILRTREEKQTIAYAHVKMGDCHRAMGDHTKAAALYRNAFDAAADYPELRCAVLHAWYLMDASAGNISRARKHALAMHRESLTAPAVPAPAILLRNLALDLRKKEAFDDALAVYRDARTSAAVIWRAERISLEIARTLAEKGDMKRSSDALAALREDAASADIRADAACDAMLVFQSMDTLGDARFIADSLRKDPALMQAVPHAGFLARLVADSMTEEEFRAGLKELPKDRRNDALLALAIGGAMAGHTDAARKLLRECVESGSGIEWPSRLAARKLKDLPD